MLIFEECLWYAKYTSVDTMLSPIYNEEDGIQKI